jgi:hypothetical protein
MPEDPPKRGRRERSARYPGVPLAESVDLARFIESRGLDGLSAAEIASALGYTNVKTNTFSARLSAARQFGLLELNGDGYALTPLARSILHPVDPSELPRLHRQAFLSPPLYAELSARLADRRVPEASILANVLYRNHHITASAKDSAAASFLDSARFAGLLGDDSLFHPDGQPAPAPAGPLETFAAPPPSPPPRARPADVRLDLRLWGVDAGKVLRLRAPESITAASFERFLQAFRLLVRIEESDPKTP